MGVFVCHMERKCSNTWTLIIIRVRETWTDVAITDWRNNNVHGCWFQATGQSRGVIRNVERRGRLGSKYSLLCRCGAHYFSWPKKKWRRSQMLPSLSCQHHRHLHRLRVGGQHKNGRRMYRGTTKLPFHWLKFSSYYHHPPSLYFRFIRRSTNSAAGCSRMWNCSNILMYLAFVEPLNHFVQEI